MHGDIQGSSKCDAGAMWLLKLLRVVLALCIAQYRSDTRCVRAPGICATHAQMADVWKA